MFGQRGAQRLARSMAPGLDRSLGNPEQLARFGAGQAVQHGRLQRGAQLRGQLRSIVNGTASVKAWADTTTFTGTFYLSGGPDGYDRASATQKWTAGGAGYVFAAVPQGGTYTATSWTTSGDETGLVTFGV